MRGVLPHMGYISTPDFRMVQPTGSASTVAGEFVKVQGTFCWSRAPNETPAWAKNMRDILGK